MTQKRDYIPNSLLHSIVYSFTLTFSLLRNPVQFYILILFNLLIPVEWQCKNI